MKYYFLIIIAIFTFTGTNAFLHTTGIGNGPWYIGKDESGNFKLDTQAADEVVFDDVYIRYITCSNQGEGDVQKCDHRNKVGCMVWNYRKCRFPYPAIKALEKLFEHGKLEANNYRCSWWAGFDVRCIDKEQAHAFMEMNLSVILGDDENQDFIERSILDMYA